MRIRRTPTFLLSTFLTAALSVTLMAEEMDLVLDTFETGFQFGSFSSTDENVAYNAGSRFFIEDSASMSWTDTGAGIYNGSRNVTVNQFQGTAGNLVSGRVLDNRINVGANLGVRATVNLDYDLRSTPGDNTSGVDISATQYLTFDVGFDAQANETTRALVTFSSGTTSTTAEIGFRNADEGLNSIDLNSLQTKYDWDATTWTNIKDNITDVEFAFFSTGYGDDYSFATYAFTQTSAGGNLGQVPEPTSLLMLGALIGGGLLRSPRRSRAKA